MTVSTRRATCVFAVCLGLLAGSVEGTLSAEEKQTRVLLRDSNTLAESCEGEELESLSLSTRVWIPQGTETWKVGRALHFRVPAGYVVWNRTKDGLFLPLEGGTVECACAGGGCDPVVAGSDIVCAIRPACASGCCKRTVVKSQMAAVVVTEAEGGIRRARNRELKTLPNASAELLQIPEIAAAFEEFVAKAHQGRAIPGVDFKGNRIEAPTGYKFLPVNIYGYLASVLVPRDNTKCVAETLAESDEEYIDDCEGAAKVTCKCNEGTGCTYKSEKFGQLVYCESGSCSRCQMSTQ